MKRRNSSHPPTIFRLYHSRGDSLLLGRGSLAACLGRVELSAARPAVCGSQNAGRPRRGRLRSSPSVARPSHPFGTPCPLRPAESAHRTPRPDGLSQLRSLSAHGRVLIKAVPVPTHRGWPEAHVARPKRAGFPLPSVLLSSKAGERRPSEERSDDSLGRRERCAPGQPGAGGTTDVLRTAHHGPSGRIGTGTIKVIDRAGGGT